MGSLVIFGAPLSEILAEDEKPGSNYFHSVGDLSCGFVTAKIFGYRAINACVSLDEPLLFVLPKISAPAADCDYKSPVRAWAVDEVLFKNSLNKTNVFMAADGIFVAIEDFKIEDGWFVGVFRIKAVAMGIKLLDVGVPFKTKNDVVIIDDTFSGFDLKAVLYIRRINPPQVCVKVTIKGPFGYKDSKEVCS